MRHRRLTSFTTALATAGAALVPSVIGAATGTDEPLRIVALINESGQYATSGGEAVQGLELRIAELNAGGGVLGRPVELERLDTASDTARTTQLAQSIEVSDDLLAVVGPQGGATCYAAREILADKGILQYCDTGAPIPGEDGPGELSPLYFSMYAGPAYAGGELIAQFAAARDIGSIGVISSNDTSGEMYRNMVELVDEDAEFELTGVETFDAADVDVSAQIAKLSADGAEMIYVGSTGSGLVTVLQAVNDLGLDVPVLAGWGNGTTAMAELVKDDLPTGGLFVYGDVVHVWDELPSDNPDRAQFEALAPTWEAAYGTGPTWGGVANYDAVSIIALAAEAVGSNDHEAMAEWILNDLGEFDGLAYTYRFTPDNHRGVLGSGIVAQYNSDGGYDIAEELTPEGADE